MAGWTFLTNHGQVILAIANNPESTERELALAVGITERAVQRIIADLETAGYLTRTREGRRNRYRLHADLPLRHQLANGIPLGDLLRALSRADDERARETRAVRAATASGTPNGGVPPPAEP